MMINLITYQSYKTTVITFFIFRFYNKIGKLKQKVPQDC